MEAVRLSKDEMEDRYVARHSELVAIEATVLRFDAGA